MDESRMDGSLALPEFFEPLLARQYDASTVSRIVEGCRVRRVSSLRANALLSSREEVASALDEVGIAHHPVSWYGDAFVIEGAHERALWDLPVYEQGKIYLQSLSSMLPPLVLGAQPGLDILDMCAAPGGKTTQLAALGGKGTRITACEMHAPRAEKLEYNLRKQGAGNVVVMRIDARRLDDFFRFDRILLDAPCSGSGTLRVRDPKLHMRFTEKLIQKSRGSQQALLDKALALLKPGGTLVYSTCSVLACENEDVVTAALKQAGRYGSYKVEPIELPSATLAPVSLVASAAAPAAAPAPAPALASTAAALADILPLLPTALEGALCVCPTAYFEGFFVAKIVRTA